MDEGDRVEFGGRLKSAISSFTIDLIPHMNEEEEVCCVCMHKVEGCGLKATSWSYILLH